ncbi:hypothetical protein KS4_27730 [Poriferisphaera corsica]|uniref:Uncharacterized protein n=1 Tax=Poriferisphaera corsica TaxID=2528020 RepID=A0A517YWW8_9BACT|nr:glycoside hydrolase [Poriferisphaera corsica]QDU34699.1 hypothetical protein KS4_27730 [Poriferisphaera corsica]
MLSPIYKSTSFVLLSLLLCAQQLISQTITLQSDQYTYTIDPSSMQVTQSSPTINPITLSSPNSFFDSHQIENQQPQSAQWQYTDPQLSAHAEIVGNDLRITFSANITNNDQLIVPFPTIQEHPTDTALTLPLFEGVYIDKNATAWRTKLQEIENERLTAAFSFPAMGILGQDNMRIIIFEHQYNNKLTVTTNQQNQIAFNFARTFNRLQKDNQIYSVLFQTRPNNLLGSAIAYRQYMKQNGLFVSLKQKMAANPNIKRMIGAIQAYVWGPALVYGSDLTRPQTKQFINKLTTATPDHNPEAFWLRNQLTPEEATQLKSMTNQEWLSNYDLDLIAVMVNRILQLPDWQNATFISNKTTAQTAIPTRLRLLKNHIGTIFNDHHQWGSGISTRMIDMLQSAGIKRAHISTGGINSTNLKPQVALAADTAGYLFGPYDSYHSVHNPKATGDHTWDTAQFDLNAFEDGAIIRYDGKPIHGFKKIGRKLSPLVAMPYVKKRVNAVTANVPHNSWFVDCDAFGELYDDWNPKHEASENDGSNARLDRLRWLKQNKNLIVGSEGGSAYAAPVIDFAHGMLTPVIGWADPARTDKQSKYYVGRYYPENQPDVFFKPVPLQEKYINLYYNPAVRLPLFQALTHDSVVATHHWSNATLKYTNTINTMMLIETLYNTPPLYHLNPTQFPQNKDIIIKHAQMFNTTHQQLWDQPITNITFLNNERTIQQTQFNDSGSITANFTDQPFKFSNTIIPPRSAYIQLNKIDKNFIYTP